MAAGAGQHGQAGPTASRPTYRLIQVLRAIAALVVVAHHATIMLVQRDHIPHYTWINGESGVDIFFVISGFVMTISSEPLLRRAAHPARTFLARRLERLVPMYWIVTTAKVAALLLVPALGINALGSAWHIVASYLFLPSLNPEHVLEPVVVVGWTLNYEMGFYVLFALALAVRARPVLLVAPVLLGVALWHASPLPAGPVWLHFYETTLGLEFLWGVLLALGLRALREAPPALGAALVLLGFYPLLFWMAPGFLLWRGVLWGLPATAVVAGALMLERRWGARSPRWLLALGDASYSIYLVHTFALPALGLLLHRLDLHWAALWDFALTCGIVVSALAGFGVYRFVELPITLWFKGRRPTAIPAVVSAS